MTTNFTKRSIYLIIIFVLVFLVIVGIIAYGLNYYYSNKNITPTSTPPVDNVLIKVSNPLPNQEIQSPIVVRGQARGYWFFEATFPIKLLDENGNVLVQTYAQAQGDWMTENFVPFESVLTFSVNKNQKGTLVLEKDNPSGLAENAKEIRIPVNLIADKQQMKAVKLYYYNSNLDRDGTGNILCSRNGLVAVNRQIPITNTPIQDTINLLISGNLTSAEKAQGITTEYPLQGFKLTAASLNGSVLTLTFNDPNNKTGGGSCRVGILWFQIEATAKQFAGVSSVKFAPEGLFQP
ncbi:MAG: Gmad2 immunoglobulin-like domain-containing protein [Candidatus Staskawiczbacteria bacterium]|jgi:hypothetical protein